MDESSRSHSPTASNWSRRPILDDSTSQHSSTGSNWSRRPTTGKGKWGAVLVLVATCVLSLGNVSNIQAIQRGVFSSMAPLAAPTRMEAVDRVADALETLWDNLKEPVVNGTESHNVIVSNFITPPASPRVHNNSELDIVLLTHSDASETKLDNLWRQLRFWNGPAAVALYIKNLEQMDTFLQFYQIHWRELQTIYPTTFHVMLEKTIHGYPHNILRNLVLERLEADYFLALDVDFIPPQNSHENLRNLLMQDERVTERLQNRWLLVLPAFELRYQNKWDPVSNSTLQIPPTEDMLPHTKADVRALRTNGTVIPFHIAESKGHRPTQFRRWFYKKQPDIWYTIEFKGNFEPYVVGYRRGIPRLWNDFRGFGSNKVSWFKELDRAGYQFAVLRDYFVTHINHPVKNTKSHGDIEANRRTFGKFMTHIKKQYSPVRREEPLPFAGN